MRRLLLVAVLSLPAGPALASDVLSAWVKQLTVDGYEEITITRTWLGRVRIVAEKGNLEREIIINRRTGEVLRDYSRDDHGDVRLPLGFTVGLEDDDGEDDGQEEPDQGDEADDPDDGGEEDKQDDNQDEQDEQDEEDDGEDDGADEGDDENDD